MLRLTGYIIVLGDFNILTVAWISLNKTGGYPEPITSHDGSCDFLCSLTDFQKLNSCHPILTNWS